MSNKLRKLLLYNELRLRVNYSIWALRECRVRTAAKTLLDKRAMARVIFVMLKHNLLGNGALPPRSRWSQGWV